MSEITADAMYEAAHGMKGELPVTFKGAAAPLAVSSNPVPELNHNSGMA